MAAPIAATRVSDRLHWVRGLIASFALATCLLSQWWLTGKVAVLRSVGADEYPMPLNRIARFGDLLGRSPVLTLLFACGVAAAVALACRSVKSRPVLLLAWLGTGLLVAAAAYYGLGFYGVHVIWNPSSSLSS
ncbi:MAG TPA: hypothetical protein QGH10_10655 [Armatimonadota bacterium]|nr:hypothetical protein [Armatimonadota bacterium]